MGNDDYKIVDTTNKVVKEVKSGVSADPANTVTSNGNLDTYHFQNFVDTIRDGGKLNSPVDEGAKSVLLCHLANIAQRTGQTLHCDPSNGHILNSPDGTKLWRREYENGWEPKIV